jgi:hypothetical protein
VEIEVADTTPPVISAVATPSELRPPDHSLREIAVDLHAEDSCSSELTIDLVSLTSSEPDDAVGDGNTMADIQQAEIGEDDRHFLLRAERQGGGSGRVYTATYRATDAEGNHSDAVTRVTVPHDASKGAQGTPEPHSMSQDQDEKDTKKKRKQARAAKKAAKKAARAARRAAR